MLSDLDLLPVYDSSSHDLVRDLTVPLMENSTKYIRGVGFFTSGWLQVASQGLVSFAESGGQARYVVSPILTHEDLDALHLGEEARQDDVLLRALERSIGTLAEELETHTRNALAWLVADGVLDFRIAVPRQAYRGGDYHDKVGVFTDSHGDRVAFHGSLNDTMKGSLNGEAFSVFRSWVAGQSEYVTAHQERLEALWESGNAQFSTHTIPEAIREELLQLRSGQRPYSPAHSGTSHDFGMVPEGPVQPFPLRDYQDEAIAAWEHNDCRGILEMATGTGKTYTALAAATRTYDKLGKLALLIEVPYLHLVDQWEEHCIRFGYSPVLCSGSHGGWHTLLAGAVQDFRVGARNALCAIAVHQTAASERFARALRGLPANATMIVADEVHGLGAHYLRNALTDAADIRLGLSATPQRWFDAEGTALLEDYFGGVCFEFSLAEAIDADFLVPYDYTPLLCRLDTDETEEYVALSDRIRTLLADDGQPVSQQDQEDLKRLLLARALLIGQAQAKIPLLLDHLRHQISQSENAGSELRHVLVYCAPGTHREVLTSVASLGLRCHEFTARVSRRDRQEILKQFERGDIQVLIAIRCLDESVDVPAA